MLYLLLGYLIILTCLPIKKKRNMILAGVIPIIIFTIFRYGVGADYFSYESIYMGLRDYTYIESLNVYKDIELPFRTIMFMFTSIGIPYHWFNVIISVSVITIVTMWINDNLATAKSVSYGILIFYAAFLFVWSWSALRQGLALAIVVYFFYNRKHDFGMKAKIIATIIASMFHVSALINFIFLFSKKLTKKSLLIMLLGSLLITLIPLDLLFNIIGNLPLVSKISAYLEPRFGFWTFADLVRLGFFVIAFFYYDYFSKDEYGKNLINSFMLGFVIYFAFNAVPIAAGRLNIYTFFLIVIIIPIFLEGYKQLIFKLMAIMFSILFMFKESNTMQLQSGLQSEGYLVPYSNVLNIKQYVFKDYFHERRTYTSRKEEELLDFMEIQNDVAINDIGSHNQYKVAFSEKSKYYGVINQNGEVVHEFKYYRPMYIFDNIMMYYHTQEGVDLYTVYDLDTNESVYFEDVKDTVDMNESAKFQTIRIWDLDPNLLGEDVLSIFKSEDMLSGFRIMHIEDPVPYKIMKVTYFHKDVFVYLDEDYNLLIDDYFYNYALMDDQGFIQLDNDTTTEIYNSLGELIWMSKKHKDYFSLK